MDEGAVTGSSIITKFQLDSKTNTRRVDFNAQTICQGYGTMGETRMVKQMRLRAGGTTVWSNIATHTDTAAIAAHTDSYTAVGQALDASLDTEHDCRALPGDAWDAFFSGYIIGV
jgi:hypothetical protein